ncbi:conjugal transfer protein TraL [Bacillus sp. 1663tsa1]|uniref:conjugal transfer protein TrbL family protein n=1 Tax=Bacillus sp. 1663tsa1 TaxID=2953804 RepID=UPI00209E7959|nr:conjugal transfer protein TrbL family protein [Bacillus sp. 1663tsa1]MCP1181194.1 conjugal transfer protein TraL [Bacillus sp. 1663tsa1]
MKLKKVYQILSIVLLIFVAMNTNLTTAYAKKGEFYDQNKKAIEKEIKNKDKQEFIKNYDYKDNYFDCGTFDVSCKVSGLAYESIIGTIKITYDSLKSTVIKPSDITGNKEFKKYKNGFSGLSSTMLAIFLMWQILKIYSMRYVEPDGDGFLAINEKMIMTLTAGVLLGIYDPFINWVLEFQEVIVKSVLYEPIKMEEVVLMIFIKGSLYGFFIALIVMFVLFVFALAFMYRFVLFGLLYVVGVVAIPTALNDEYNYFSLWIRLFVNNSVTLCLQALTFSLGFMALVKNNAFGHGVSFTVAFAFFILALAIPHLLGQLGASTGTSRAIGQSVRYLSRRR